MARKGNNPSPPQTMTWSKATPFIAIAAVFDSIRFFFSWFWLLGPAIAAGLCTSGVNSFLGTSVGSLVGKVVGAACAFASGVAGFYLSPVLTFFGVIMAMAFGFAGWIIMWTLLAVNNPRIFSQNAKAIWTLLFGLGVSELPLINALPALSVSTWRIYHTQIKEDRKILKDWHSANSARLQRERLQLAQFAHSRAEQEEREYEEELAAREEEIHEEDDRLAA